MDGEALAAVQDRRRLRALRQIELLDTPPEEAFDRFTRLAARLLQAPIALISLVDEQRQFFKSAVGLPEPWASSRGASLSGSLSAHVVVTRAPLIVGDLTSEPRLLGIGSGELNVVAYVGMPLITAEGHVIGSFCVIDHVPRQWPERDLALLGDLAAMVIGEIERRLAVADLREANRQLHLLTDALPVQIAYVDRDERYQYVNAAYTKRFARSTESILGMTVKELQGADTYARVAPLLQATLAGEAQRFDLPHQPPGGKRTIYDVSYLPQRDPDGVVQGFYVLVIDVTAHREAEITAQQNLERAELALQAGQMGVWEWRIGADEAFVSEQLVTILGGTAGSSGAMSTGQFLQLVHEDDRAGIKALMDEHVARREGYAFECRIQTPDGQVRWLMCRALYKTDERGDRLYGVCADITERKHVEQTQQMLLEELNHRVRNTLAIVNSIAGQTLKHSPSLDYFSEAFAGRIQALASTHTLLSSNRWQPSSLAQLVEKQLAPYSRSRLDAVMTSGPEILITPKPALTLSLVLHELATNAAKYGALSSAQGQVDVSWTIEQAPERRQLLLTWSESGGPPVAAAPERNGFGAQLIQFNIAHEFGGRVETTYRPTGVLHRLIIPLPRWGNRL